MKISLSLTITYTTEEIASLIFKDIATNYKPVLIHIISEETKDQAFQL